MSDWLGANWIWILLGVGAVWFMFKRGGMGCGMGGHGGHGGHDESDPARKEQGEEQSMSTRGSRHGGGCH